MARAKVILVEMEGRAVVHHLSDGDRTDEQKHGRKDENVA